jgi:hypothetical protein
MREVATARNRLNPPAAPAGRRRRNDAAGAGRCRRTAWRRRRGLRLAVPWEEEVGLEEEGAAACKRRWGKGAAGVVLVRVRVCFYICLFV